MREQRLVFGEVAELYDRARAGYPEAVVDAVLGFSATTPTTAVEVGAGTGKATVAFARRGLDITAVEPSPEMAAVAERNCAPFPNVRIELTSFEDWPAAGPADLVFSAQAWHWVSPAVRYRKAAAILEPGGTLALFWHRTAWEGDPLFDELQAVYRRLAPDLLARNPGFPGLTPQPGHEDLIADVARDGLFDPPHISSHPWTATFTAHAFTDLLLTQSDHRLLDDAVREPLLAAIRDLIPSEVVVPHAVLLVLTRRAS